MLHKLPDGQRESVDDQGQASRSNGKIFASQPEDGMRNWSQAKQFVRTHYKYA